MKQLPTIALLFLAQLLQARTLPVGAGHAYATIRAAIAASADGDTVLVKKGVYKEGNLILTKSIALLGEAGAVLDGEDKYEMLTVSSNGAAVKGLRFQNAGYSGMNDYAAIKIIDARYVLVEDNTIADAYFAVHVSNASHCAIINNNIAGRTKTEQTSGNGIHLWKCNNMLLRGNDISGHRDGIYFEFVTHSIIENNNSYNNIRYGLHFMFSNDDSYVKNTFRDNGAGVAVMYSHRVVMMGNGFVHNWGGNAYGLLLKEISDGRIIGNAFTENTIGISLESTNRIDAHDNNFNGSGYAIRMSASCNENTVHHNRFEGNTFDVATNGTLTLNRFYKNYWDKYDGYDINHDGIGDAPYHPVSMYAMVIEDNPAAAILLRSFMVTLLDKAERALPSLTPEALVDEQPLMKTPADDSN